MNCPVCDERLRQVEKLGVEIDICPGCKGVWLDRGELDKIIELVSNSNVAPDTAPSRLDTPIVQAPYQNVGDDRSDGRPAYREEYRDREHHRDEHDRDRDERYREDRPGDERETRRGKSKRGGILGEIFDIFGGD
jgi:uncharacterized protein